MKSNPIPVHKTIKNRATKMRKNPTEEEAKLWYAFLRKYKPNFNRQKVVGSYILDFYCSKLKLCIEVDGDQHYFSENKEKEERRTNFIEKKGIKILRILNSDVKSRFTDTVRYIEAVCHERAVELNLDDSIFEIEG